MSVEDVFNGLYPNGFGIEEFNMLKKTQFTSKLGAPNVPPEADDMALTYPNVFDFLTQEVWEDGEVRKTGSVLLFVDGGAFKAMARDPNTYGCLWVTALTMGGLFAVLEQKMVDPQADWKKDRYAVERGERLRKRK